MQYTTHYNLNLPEGTDVVNPLVQDNPNYTAIDGAMFANKQSVIGTATEVTSGTAHAITRVNTDSNYFKFTATSNWTAGDTMTVDGNPVSLYLSDGTTPATGSYVINTEVLALLNGTRVTLITSKSDPSASNISYDNTGSGLSAENIQDAVDELASDMHARQFLGSLNIGQSVNIPDGIHNLYIKCDVNSYYFSPTYSSVIVPYLDLPFPIGDTWVGTERLTYDSITKNLTYYAESTVFGSKAGTWTTNIAVWYD